MTFQGSIEKFDDCQRAPPLDIAGFSHLPEHGGRRTVVVAGGPAVSFFTGLPADIASAKEQGWP
jgi:hypothetical protein